MKYKIGVFALAILIIFGGSWLSSSIRNGKLSLDSITKEKDEDINYDQEIAQQKTDAELQALKARIATLEKSKTQVPRTVVIDKEEECKRTADKFFTDIERVNKDDRSTYTSHWNINLKACLIEMVVRKINPNGSVYTAGIVNYDITNDKVRNRCSNEDPNESCYDSIFVSFREGLMSE